MQIGFYGTCCHIVYKNSPFNELFNNMLFKQPTENSSRGTLEFFETISGGHDLVPGTARVGCYDEVRFSIRPKNVVFRFASISRVKYFGGCNSNSKP
jgi:hypothetical protein